jgi:hypothetical protein
MTGLPSPVKKFLTNKNVDLNQIDMLNGINPGRGVFTYRVYSSKKSFILKNCSKKREFDIYTEHFSFFKNNNINIPNLYFSYEQDGEYWIVIEDVPLSFSKSRWKGDSEQIYMLYLLHSNSWNNRINLKNPYHFFWDYETMIRVQQLLPLDLTDNLYILQEKTKVIFRPLCCISGDPNPTNWRVRNNGELVLFDFERIGYGNPAIDLAITIPGLGSQDGSLEYKISEKYISHWHNSAFIFPFSIDDFAKQISIAKLWSALDFLAHNFNTINNQNVIPFIEQLKEKLKVYC